MARGLPAEALPHIEQLPDHIKRMGETRISGKPVIKLAATLKIMAKDQVYILSDEEFKRDYSAHKHYPTYLKKRLSQLGVSKPRIVKDAGRVYIWSNDDK